jgi:hypothetical protein
VPTDPLALKIPSPSTAYPNPPDVLPSPWQQSPPVRNRAEGHHRYSLLSPKNSRYCLSYTDVLLNFLPCGSVPLAVAVRVLPSADTTTRPVIVTLPPFLIVNVNV